MELIKITNNGVSAKELYDFLFQNVENPTPFSMWIKRRIGEYGFENKKDFVTYLLESTGGRKFKDYSISLDMAKELAMVEKTDIGKDARKYFIKCESIARKTESIRMHGFAYSGYTKLVYKLCGIKYKKIDNFRDTLTIEELERVKNVESMIKPLLEIKKEYSEIKDILYPIFVKQLQESN